MRHALFPQKNSTVKHSENFICKLSTEADQPVIKTENSFAIENRSDALRDLLALHQPQFPDIVPVTLSGISSISADLNISNVSNVLVT